MDNRQLDQALVERVQHGDQRAFGLLVVKHQHRLARVLSHLIQDPAEVEDVAQEAFLKAYRALPGFRGNSAFYTWLYRIGVNAAKNHLVSKRRHPPTSTSFNTEDAETFEDGEQLRDMATPENILASRQLGETVNRAMDALPRDLCTAISLRELDGLSYAEIAQVMECPIGTVRSRVFRAREAVAEQLRPLLNSAPEKRW